MMVNRKSRWWLIAVPLGVIVGAGLALWLRASSAVSGLLPKGERIEVPFTGVTDTDDNRAANVAAFANRYRLVAFGYTACPDVCPTTLLSIHRALQALGTDAERVAPIFISVDPERDTPERLKKYLAAFDPRFHGLVGSSAATEKITHAFRVRYDKHFLSGTSGDYSMDHTAILYLLDPQWRVVAAIPEGTESSRLTEKIVAAVRAIGPLDAS
jgi:protein SCO1/2